MSGVRSHLQFWRLIAAAIPSRYTSGLSGRPHFGEFGRAARFLVTGGFATLLNLCFLWLLVTQLGLPYLAAGILAFSISIASNFACQKLWTFPAAGMGRLGEEVAGFVAVNLVNLLLNTAILYILVQRLGAGYLVAQMASSALIAIESYYAYRLIFARRSNEHVGAGSEIRLSV